jgi:hypothetical protein
MKREYKPYPERDIQINDAKKIIGAVLPLDISPEMKKKVIRQMIWNITGVDYKYKIRYQSQKVIDDSNAAAIHEHVYPLVGLIEDILSNRDNFEHILDERAIACIVTKDEHDELTKNDIKYPQIKGWKRYVQAGIDVYDFAEKKPLDLTTVINND